MSNNSHIAPCCGDLLVPPPKLAPPDWPPANCLPNCQHAVRTSLDLGLVLDAVIGLTAAQEVLAAAGGLDVLNAHVDALAHDAAVHLQQQQQQRQEGCDTAQCDKHG